MEAMKKVESIKQKRQALFINNRLKKGKELRKEQDIKDVEKHLNLIEAPKAVLKKKDQILTEEHEEEEAFKEQEEVMEVEA